MASRAQVSTRAARSAAIIDAGLTAVSRGMKLK
jgi:hypothetical protein